MGIRLLLYLGILFLGILIGYKEISHKKLLDKLSHLQMAALVILLFVMGIRIGVDKEVINSLGTLGFQAFYLSSCAIIGSVLAVFLYRKARNYNKRGEKK